MPDHRQIKRPKTDQVHSGGETTRGKGATFHTRKLRLADVEGRTLDRPAAGQTLSARPRVKMNEVAPRSKGRAGRLFSPNGRTERGRCYVRLLVQQIGRA